MPIIPSGLEIFRNQNTRFEKLYETLVQVIVQVIVKFDTIYSSLAYCSTHAEHNNK